MNIPQILKGNFELYFSGRNNGNAWQQLILTIDFLTIILGLMV